MAGPCSSWSARLPQAAGFMLGGLTGGPCVGRICVRLTCDLRPQAAPAILHLSAVIMEEKMRKGLIHEGRVRLCTVATVAAMGVNLADNTDFMVVSPGLTQAPSSISIRR